MQFFLLAVLVRGEIMGGIPTILSSGTMKMLFRLVVQINNLSYSLHCVANNQELNFGMPPKICAS